MDKSGNNATPPPNLPPAQLQGLHRKNLGRRGALSYYVLAITAEFRLRIVKFSLGRADSQRLITHPRHTQPQWILPFAG